MRDFDIGIITEDVLLGMTPRDAVETARVEGRAPLAIDGAAAQSYWFSSSWIFGSSKFSLVTTCAGISTTLGSTFSPLRTLSIACTPR